MHVEVLDYISKNLRTHLIWRFQQKLLMSVSINESVTSGNIKGITSTLNLVIDFENTG